MRVLVVEDEAALRDELAARLRAQGYAVDVAADGEEGAYCGLELPIDAAVVDLGLPRLGGLEIIRRWRAAGRGFPVLVLTARGRWQDKVDGLEAGADDYVVKPFHVQELLARLRALVRRAGGWSEPVLRCGPLRVDTAAQRVEMSSRPVELTAFEYKVLEYLTLHAGEVVSKSRLSEHLYEEDLERDSNVLEVIVARLRRKLDPQRRIEPIETVRGRGYRLRLGRGGA